MQRLAALIVAIAGICGAAQADGTGTIRVATWGGSVGHAQQMAYFNPFMRANPDIHIQIDPVTDATIAALQKRGDAAPEFDLIAVTSGQAAALCEAGHAEVLDPDTAFAATQAGLAGADFAETLTSDCFVPSHVLSQMLAVRTDVGNPVPDNVCAVFDPVTFPGPRGLSDHGAGTLEWALYCDGIAWPDVRPALLTEGGLARAFGILDRIAGDIVWWRNAGEPAAALAAGEVVMTTGPNGRFFELMQRQLPVQSVWTGQILDFEGFIVSAGLSEGRRNLVLTLLAELTEPVAMAQLSAFVPFGPARHSAVSLVSEHRSQQIDMSAHIPNAPEHLAHAWMHDDAWWAAHGDRINAALSEWRQARAQ